jgi:hypothetical protein
MALNYMFIGWYRDPESNADKIWGVIKLADTDDDWTPTDFVSFWGRRGKKLQTKTWKNEYPWELESAISAKERKGYKGVDLDKLNEVYPEFEEDLEKTTVWAILSA